MNLSEEFTKLKGMRKTNSPIAAAASRHL